MLAKIFVGVITTLISTVLVNRLGLNKSKTSKSRKKKSSAKEIKTALLINLIFFPIAWLLYYAYNYKYQVILYIGIYSIAFAISYWLSIVFFPDLEHKSKKDKSSEFWQLLTVNGFFYMNIFILYHIGFKALINWIFN